MHCRWLPNALSLVINRMHGIHRKCGQCTIRTIDYIHAILLIFRLRRRLCRCHSERSSLCCGVASSFSARPFSLVHLLLLLIFLLLLPRCHLNELCHHVIAQTLCNWTHTFSNCWRCCNFIRILHSSLIRTSMRTVCACVRKRAYLPA